MNYRERLYHTLERVAGAAGIEPATCGFGVLSSLLALGRSVSRSYTSASLYTHVPHRGDARRGSVVLCGTVGQWSHEWSQKVAWMIRDLR